MHMTEMTETAPRRGVPMWVQIVVFAALIGLLVLVGLTLRKRQEGQIQLGTAIPNFSIPLYSGYQIADATQFNLNDYRGKVVVINFWASWCKPCEQEAAELEQAWTKYEPTGQVVFIGVDYVDTEPEARVYLEKYGITYANGPDMGTKVSQLFRITGVPETYFIDRKGVLRFAQIGPFLSANDIQTQIEALLAE
jgi:cytochrome c biogenesis protein CcmG/thiol:disulfide interchange protein DsbE